MQKIGKKVTVTLPEETLEEIEKLAEKLQMSKAEASRKLLELGLDTYNIYKYTGITKLAEIVRKQKLKRKKQEKSD